MSSAWDTDLEKKCLPPLKVPKTSGSWTGTLSELEDPAGDDTKRLGLGGDSVGRSSRSSTISVAPDQPDHTTTILLLILHQALKQEGGGSNCCFKSEDLVDLVGCEILSRRECVFWNEVHRAQIQVSEYWCQCSILGSSFKSSAKVAFLISKKYINERKVRSCFDLMNNNLEGGWGLTRSSKNKPTLNKWRWKSMAAAFVPSVYHQQLMSQKGDPTTRSTRSKKTSFYTRLRFFYSAVESLELNRETLGRIVKPWSRLTTSCCCYLQQIVTTRRRNSRG